MKSYIEKRVRRQLMTLTLCALFVLGAAMPAAAYYYAPPAWNNSLSYGQNFGWGGYNYSGYQNYSNPYLYAPSMGVYYPYNTRFDIYNSGYNYNAGFMGNYTNSYAQNDINSYGYPFPYALTNQNTWGNQTGVWGYPPMGNTGNTLNVNYNPTAFTYDLGIDAYYTGIGNFWRDIFNKLNEADEEEQ